MVVKFMLTYFRKFDYQAVSAFTEAQSVAVKNNMTLDKVTLYL